MIEMMYFICISVVAHRCQTGKDSVNADVFQAACQTGYFAQATDIYRENFPLAKFDLTNMHNI